MVTLLDATITVDESGGIANQCCLELMSGDLAIDVTVLLTTGAAGDTADRKLTQLPYIMQYNNYNILLYYISGACCVQ